VTREDQKLYRFDGMAEEARIVSVCLQGQGSFPRAEMFGIVSQLRRASASVAANIAQGFGRRTTREVLRSLQILAGELEETRYFLILSPDLGYLAVPTFEKAAAMCDSVGQLINALGRLLKARGEAP
jgi:four helix bundle protein